MQRAAGGNGRGRTTGNSFGFSGTRKLLFAPDKQLRAPLRRVSVLINLSSRARFFSLIGQVGPLPHSRASDATSWRVLHVRLCLLLSGSLAGGQEETEPDGGALEPQHFSSREKSGAHEQRLPLSLSISISLSDARLSPSLSRTPTLARSTSASPPE